MEVDWVLLPTRYGERWRQKRKIAERSLRPGAMSQYHQRIEEKTRGFLRQILASPADFRGHIHLSVVLFLNWCCSLESAELFRFQGKIIMSLVYGYDLKEDDQMAEAPVQLTNILTRFVLPGAALVIYLPFRMNLRVVINAGKRN